VATLSVLLLGVAGVLHSHDVVAASADAAVVHHEDLLQLIALLLGLLGEDRLHLVAEQGLLVLQEDELVLADLLSHEELVGGMDYVLGLALSSYLFVALLACASGLLSVLPFVVQGVVLEG
jgi:hypothetical protein